MATIKGSKGSSDAINALEQLNSIVQELNANLNGLSGKHNINVKTEGVKDVENLTDTLERLNNIKQFSQKNPKKYFQSIENAEESLRQQYNKVLNNQSLLGKWDNKEISDIELFKDKSKDISELWKYANAFEALGGNIRDIDPQMADFISKIRQIYDTLDNSTKGAYPQTIENFKELFDLLKSVPKDALTEIGFKNLTKDVQQAKTQVMSFEDVLNRIRESRNGSNNNTTSSGESQSEQNKPVSEETEQLVARTREEIQKLADEARKLEKEKIDLGFLDELDTIQKLAQELERLKEQRDHFLNEAVGDYDIALNTNDPNSKKTWLGWYESDLAQYKEYANQVEIVQTKLDEAALEFDPSQMSGDYSEAIAVIIKLFQTLIREVTVFGESLSTIANKDYSSGFANQFTQIKNSFDLIKTSYEELKTMLSKPLVNLNISRSGGLTPIAINSELKKAYQEAIPQIAKLNDELFEKLVSNRNARLNDANNILFATANGPDFLNNRDKSKYVEQGKAAYTSEISGMQQMIELAEKSGIEVTHFKELYAQAMSIVEEKSKSLKETSEQNAANFDNLFKETDLTKINDQLDKLIERLEIIANLVASSSGIKEIFSKDDSGNTTINPIGGNENIISQNEGADLSALRQLLTEINELIRAKNNLFIAEAGIVSNTVYSEIGTLSIIKKTLEDINQDLEKVASGYEKIAKIDINKVATKSSNNAKSSSQPEKSDLIGPLVDNIDAQNADYLEQKRKEAEEKKKQADEAIKKEIAERQKTVEILKQSDLIPETGTSWIEKHGYARTRTSTIREDKQSGVKYIEDGKFQMNYESLTSQLTNIDKQIMTLEHDMTLVQAQYKNIDLSPWQTQLSALKQTQSEMVAEAQKYGYEPEYRPKYDQFKKAREANQKMVQAELDKQDNISAEKTSDLIEKNKIQLENQLKSIHSAFAQTEEYKGVQLQIDNIVSLKDVEQAKNALISLDSAVKLVKEDLKASTGSLDTVNNAFNRLSNGQHTVDTYIQAFQKLGLSATDAQAKVKPLQDALTQWKSVDVNVKGGMQAFGQNAKNFNIQENLIKNQLELLKNDAQIKQADERRQKAEAKENKKADVDAYKNLINSINDVTKAQKELQSIEKESFVNPQPLVDYTQKIQEAKDRLQAMRDELEKTLQLLYGKDMSSLTPDFFKQGSGNLLQDDSLTPKQNSQYVDAFRKMHEAEDNYSRSQVTNVNTRDYEILTKAINNVTTATKELQQLEQKRISNPNAFVDVDKIEEAKKRVADFKQELNDTVQTLLLLSGKNALSLTTLDNTDLTQKQKDDYKKSYTAMTEADSKLELTHMNEVRQAYIAYMSAVEEYGKILAKNTTGQYNDDLARQKEIVDELKIAYEELKRAKVANGELTHKEANQATEDLYKTKMPEIKEGNIKDTITSYQTELKSLEDELNKIEGNLGKKLSAAVPDDILKGYRSAIESFGKEFENQLKPENFAKIDYDKFISQMAPEYTARLGNFAAINGSLETFSKFTATDHLDDFTTRLSAAHEKIVQLFSSTKDADSLRDGLNSIIQELLQLDNATKIHGKDGTLFDAGQIKSVDDMRKKMEQYAQSVNLGSKVTEHVSEDGKSITQTYETASGSVYTLTGKVEELTQAWRANLTMAQGTNSFMKGFTSSFSMAIGQITRFASVATILNKVRQEFRNGLNTFKEYDKALTQISYTMNLTKSELSDLGQASIDMAKELSMSVSNAEAVFQIYANMNTTAEEIQKTAKPTVILSNLSGVDASKAADEVQGILQQFNMLKDSEEDVANVSMHIVDVLDNISANVAMDYAKFNWRLS